jgi:N utilization substance protein A
VAANDSNVDPVGACVGARGSRVRMVVNELRGEKVDIVPYSPDPAEFVMKALSPAKVKEVRIVPETGTAEVVVPDYQLSVAIGKEGQNARLAARLTGWRVDIKSESQLFEEEQNPVEEEWAAGEWITDEAGQMVWQPAEGGEAVSASDAGWGEVEGVAPAPAATTGAEEAEVKIDENISGGTPEPPGLSADTPEAPETGAGEVGAEAPAAASVVAEAGEEGNG